MAETEPRCLKNGEYFTVYAKVFAFHKKHINACTDTDWNDCAADLAQRIILSCLAGWQWELLYRNYVTVNIILTHIFSFM